jgi:hypothetical protein
LAVAALRLRVGGTSGCVDEIADDEFGCICTAGSWIVVSCGVVMSCGCVAGVSGGVFVNIDAYNMLSCGLSNSNACSCSFSICDNGVFFVLVTVADGCGRVGLIGENALMLVAGEHKT